MNILENIFIKKILEDLKRKRRVNSRNNIMPLKLIFICGKQLDENKESNREKLSKLISKIDEKAKCIFAEKLYFSNNSDYNLLDFENLLTNISDRTIIILESAGTYCELGAFVNRESKRNLDVINEDNPQYLDSFITKGPLKHVKTLVSYDGEMISDPKIKDYIKKLSQESIPPSTPNSKEKDLNLRSLLCELLHILYIFQPLTCQEVEYIYKYIFDLNEITIADSENTGIKSIRNVMQLLFKLDLIVYSNRYYSMKKNMEIITPIFKETDVSKIRARYVAKLYKIDLERIQGYVNR